MTKKIIFFIAFIFIFSILSLTANAQSLTATSNDQSSSSASKLKDQAKLLQEQKRETLIKAREEARALMETKREEFKVRLQTIKDEKKAALAERIDIKLNSVNKKHTDRFLEIVNKLQEFLDKMSQDKTEPKQLTDIKLAQDAVDLAKTSVEDQAAKVYAIEIVSETTLRANAGKTTSQLRKDLVATHKLVVDAKQALMKLRENNSIMKEATGSAEL